MKFKLKTEVKASVVIDMTDRLKIYQRFASVTVSLKCMSQNFDVGDLRSGKFCDLSIIN